VFPARYVTSLLAIGGSITTTGVLSAKDTYALFGNEAVFFIWRPSSWPLPS